jgi:sec-independent protein translocase protein TatB
VFGIDFSEIVVIFVIALLVLGPEKLPRLARTVGKWLGRARAMAHQFREQLEQEADQIQRTADLKAHMKPPSRPAPSPAEASTAAAAATATPPAAAAPVAELDIAADIASMHLGAQPSAPAATPSTAELNERGR